LGGILLGLGSGWIVFNRYPEPEPASFVAPAIEGTVPAGPFEGAEAPNFTLEDLEGNAVSLEGERGKVVLLNFWATWCEPCKAEMPLFDAVYRDRRDDGLLVLAVNFDEPRDLVASFRDELALSFPILMDPGAKVQQLYRVRGYPTSYWIDREGVIRSIRIGVMTDGQVRQVLQAMGLES
jgi:thiol-disulfide isomerase/thioredoxin